MCSVLAATSKGLASSVEPVQASVSGSCPAFQADHALVSVGVALQGCKSAPLRTDKSCCTRLKDMLRRLKISEAFTGSTSKPCQHASCSEMLSARFLEPSKQGYWSSLKHLRAVSNSVYKLSLYKASETRLRAGFIPYAWHEREDAVAVGLHQKRCLCSLCPAESHWHVSLALQQLVSDPLRLAEFHRPLPCHRA